LQVDPRPRLVPVGDRRKRNRLDEANQVRRDSHAHIVPAAQQLTADSAARLDITTTSLACQHKPHRGFLAFHFYVVSSHSDNGS
jgi:hypothetical protein